VLKTDYLKKALRFWRDMFRRLEGPELEPYPWHSHYLSVRYLKRHLNLLGYQLSGRILDIGAGTGHGARYLRKERTEYFPVDLPTGRNPLDRSISTTTERLKICCSCYALPLIDSCMEGVMLISVLEHLENPQLALSEAHRVTVVGGNLLVVTPFSFPTHGSPSDYRRWTMEGLIVEVSNAGFKVMDGVSMGNGFASLALNLNLLLKYHVQAPHRKFLSLAMILAAPFVVLFQLVSNILAIMLGPLDGSEAFPLAIAVLGEKVKKGVK